MAAMPRPRPPHLQRRVSRHGKEGWYVRVGRGPLIRIRGEYGSPDFLDQYRQAVNGERPQAKPGAARAGTLEWLIDQYRESSEWRGYSQASRYKREKIFRQVVASAGREPFTAITEAVIMAGRDRRRETPFQARHFLDAMRGLFAWAAKAKHVRSNPAAGVEYPILRSGQGFPVWTEEDVSAYEDRWPMGTRQRVWMAVLLYTGLRRGDAVRIGRQHVRDGVASLRTEKTDTEVHIPLLPPLLDALKAGPTAELAFICGANGKPLTKESFGNAFSEACRTAGIRKSAHGLRKIGATRLANAGATVSQLNAVFGWSGSKMAALYTETADRARQARDVMPKMLDVNGSATSMLPPQEKVVAPSEKQAKNQ